MASINAPDITQPTDSPELKTVKKCTPQLETALMGCDRNTVHFLEREGFISTEVHDEILSPKSALNDAQRAGELVRWIRNRVKQNPSSFRVLVCHFKQGGNFYEPIAKILECCTAENSHGADGMHLDRYSSYSSSFYRTHHAAGNPYQSTPGYGMPPGHYHRCPSAPGPSHNNMLMTKPSSLDGIPPNSSLRRNLEDLQRRQYSQAYSDSPPPPEGGDVPLSISQSSTSPTQRYGIQRDSNIIDQFGGLHLDGSGNRGQIIDNGLCSPNRTRTGSYGNVDLSQGSVNYQVNIVQNVIVVSSSDADESDCLSLYVQELGYFDKQLSPEQKERQLTDVDMFSKCGPHVSKWKHIAREFGMTEAKINQLESDYGKVSGSIRECAYQAYLEWQRTRSKSCTVWEMVKILHRSKEYEAIAFLLGHGLV